jgi:Domain of unknown function (DUF4149)
MLRLGYSLAVATWLGAVVALTFVVTPGAHGALPPGDARRLLRPLFPRFFLLGLLCGFGALATVLAGRDVLSRAEALRLALPAAAALVCTLVSYFVLLPRLRDLPRDDPGYARLHQVAAMLNTTTLAALVLAMAAAVTR